VTGRLPVVDASVVVEVLRRTEFGDSVAAAMRGATLAAPAHLDAEVRSALGRPARAGDAEPAMVAHALDRLVRLLPQRRRASGEPLPERSHALSEREDLLAGQIESGHHEDPVISALDIRPGPTLSVRRRSSTVPAEHRSAGSDTARLPPTDRPAGHEVGTSIRVSKRMSSPTMRYRCRLPEMTSRGSRSYMW
jgi:predicted nucleic acid-binding protein